MGTPNPTNYQEIVVRLSATNHEQQTGYLRRQIVEGNKCIPVLALALIQGKNCKLGLTQLLR